MSAIAYWLTWLFVFALPWENAVSVIPGTAIVTKVAGALSLAAALGAMVMSGRLRRWHPMHLAGLFFLIWSGGELFLTQMVGTRLPYKYTTYVQLFAVMLILWEIAPSWSRLIGLMTAYVFGAYVAALATLMLYRQEARELNRFAAVQTDPNSLAMTLALALPMAWYLGMTFKNPILRWVCRAFIAVGLVSIGLTASRGGMVAASVALMIVPLTMTKLSPGRLIAAVAMLAVSGVLAAVYIPDKIVQRLATTGTEVEDLSLGGRFKLWQAGLKALTERPLTGYGAGFWRQAVAPWLGPNPQVAHNSFLSVAVETGIVGLLLYLGMFFAVFLALMRLPSFERRFTLVLLATLMVAMLPLSWDDQKSVWFVLALLLGLSQAPGVGTPRIVRPATQIQPAPVARPPLAARPGRGAMRFSRNPDTDPMT
jgi:O-antigen ligase